MSIDKLYLPLQEKVGLFRKLIKAAGLNADVFSDYRSFAEQKKIYAQGRTTPGEIVTNSKPGYSYHNYGLAIDVVFKNKKGQWTWTSKEWEQLGSIGESLGFEWGKDFGDLPHFQFTYGLDIYKLYEIYSKTWKLKNVWLFLDGWRQSKDMK